MRRREVVRDLEVPPVELQRFRVSEWYDPDELLPDGACPHVQHVSAAAAGECETVSRGVRAHRRYREAKEAWQQAHAGKTPAGGATRRDEGARGSLGPSRPASLGAPPPMGYESRLA